MVRMKAETVRLAAAMLACLVLAGGAQAQDRAGDFTHYVLALSWNASWCALEGEARGAEQCDPRLDLGFTLHGLWPQRERGWPRDCRTRAADPSRAQTAAMADIMGSGGLAWHEWKTHGRCSALPAKDYFALSRRAYEAVAQPPALERLDRTVRIDPAVVEAAFLESNPWLSADQLAITCKQGLLQEVRVCLTQELEPRACAPQVERGCTAGSIELPPVR